MKAFKTSLIILVLVSWNIAGMGQTTGFDVLSIGPNTEALGFNEATSSLLLGASDIYSNPANLALEPSSSLNADYSLWIAELNHTHLAANFKRSNSSIAFGLLAEQADDFELRSRPGPSEGSFSVSYLSLSGAYAVRIKNISVGASAQYLREEIYIYDASGYAFNAGISSYWLGEKMLVSAVVQNIGEMDPLNLEKTPLPSQFRTGFSAEVFSFSAGNEESLPVTITLASDIVFPLQDSGGSSESDEPNAAYLNMGISIEAAEALTLRGGYKTGNTERPLSLGLGLSITNITMNYAMIPFKTGFGTVHSIGLGYAF